MPAKKRPPVEGEIRLGPAMLKLPNEKWRAFARLYVQRPTNYGARNIWDAGFNMKTKTQAAIYSSKLLADPRMLDAIREECRGDLTLLAALAVKTVRTEMRNPKASSGERIKAAEVAMKGANLYGSSFPHMGEMGDERDLLRQAVLLAGQLGVSVAALVGNRLAAELPAPTIEVKAEEIKE